MNEAVGLDPFEKNMGRLDRYPRPKYVKYVATPKGRSTTIPKIALGHTDEPPIACAEYVTAKNYTDDLPVQIVGRRFARMLVGAALAEKQPSQRSKLN